MKPDTNSLVIGDPKKCIGCKCCEVACAVAHREDNAGLTVGTMDSPIIPRLFYIKNNNSVNGGINRKSSVMTYKCDMCKETGGILSCIKACPKDALTVADLKEN